MNGIVSLELFVCFIIEKKLRECEIFVQDVPRKTNVVEVKRNGGAFQPFHKEEIAAEKDNALESDKAPTSSPQVPATSSTEPVLESGSKKDDKGQRKQRRCWSQELHKRFLHALQQLGGSNCE